MLGACACSAAIAACTVKRPGGPACSVATSSRSASAISARSHAERSCSASRSRAPSGSVRVARRASWTSSSASRPAASRSPGSSSRSMRARSSARPVRSSRTRSAPECAAWPVAYSRWITVSTASTRAGRSSGAGTAYGMRAAAIFFFARVSRAAIVGSATRNACAMSAVATPHTRRSVSATCASGASAGWQQVKTSRRRSSGMVPASGSSGSTSSRSSSSGSLASSVRPRRRALSARRRATVVSHAPGFAGTPSCVQVASAWTYASCTASSAASRSRVTRTVAAST